MLHLEARHGARRDGLGYYVPLSEQDTSLWNTAMIGEAEDILLAASHLGRIGGYQLEAVVQSAHAVRRFGGSSDWSTLRTLYDGQLAQTGSPVVAINRATVIAEVAGAQEGLKEILRLDDDLGLKGYQPYWKARAELLARCGETVKAGEAYPHAIQLEPDPEVRKYLEVRRSRLGVTGREC